MMLPFSSSEAPACLHLVTQKANNKPHGVESMSLHSVGGCCRLLSMNARPWPHLSMTPSTSSSVAVMAAKLLPTSVSAGRPHRLANCWSEHRICGAHGQGQGVRTAIVRALLSGDEHIHDPVTLRRPALLPPSRVTWPLGATHTRTLSEVEMRGLIRPKKTQSEPTPLSLVTHSPTGKT